MTTNLIQPSFAAGELSPALFERVDLAKYKSGAATMRNFFVDYRGGASTRPGTRYVATSSTPGTGLPPRLVRFQASVTVTFVLEFGNNGSSGYIAFYTGGAQVLSGGSPYTISSPYALADLPLLKFTQANDVLTITHPSYAPMQLSHISDTNWTLTTMSFGAQQAAPIAGTVTSNHAGETAPSGDSGTTYYRYKVTAVSAASGEESVASASFDNGGTSRIMSLDGMVWQSLTWSAPSGPAPASYNVYRQGEVPNGVPPAGALYGLIGSATSTTFADRNLNPDFGSAPPTNANPFASGAYPGCTAYFLERQWFAASNASPANIWASQPGAFNNFNVSYPITASDAITESLLSTQVNGIKCMVPMPTGMVVGSSGGAWLISGGSVGSGGIPASITPTDITAQPQAANGFSDVPPIVVNSDILFVQYMQGIVRDLSYNFYVNIYTGTDLTVLSNHLFSGRTIREWAYAEEPFKVVWAVQDNGGLLSLTYLKEQEVYGWARHDTLGLFQSVCTVSEPPVNATYFVVLRPMGGTWTYLIERMADRATIDGNPTMGIPANIENAWAVDCGLALPQPTRAGALYPGPGSGAAGTFTTMGCSPGTFSNADTGAVIRANGGKALVTSYVSATTVNVQILVPFATLPNDPNATPLTAAAGAWTITQPVTTVSGLSYLNGMTVSILADGNVMTPQLVNGGQITLQAPASSVVVGLPFAAQLQTLYLDTGEPTTQGKRKKVNAVSVRVKDSRGIQVGRTAATCRYIKEWNQSVSLGGPLPLASGDQRIVLDPVYDTGGQFWMQVTDPVCATILGVVPEITLGDG